VSRPLLIPEHGPAVGPLRWRELTPILLIFLLTRLAAWTGTYTGAAMHFRLDLDLAPPLAKHFRPPLVGRLLAERVRDPHTPEGRWVEDHLLHLAPLVNFDGRWYRSIMEAGYAYEPTATGERREQNIAFFPLYPLTCRLIAQACGVSTFELATHTRAQLSNAVLVAVAHLATLTAVFLLFAWLRRRAGARGALYAVTCLLCFPTACYFSYAYAECLTLLLFVGAGWLLDQRAYWPAALLSALATATRPTAAVLVLVVLLAFWTGSRLTRERRALLLAPLGVLAGAGLLAYAGYLTWRFGSPLVYARNFASGWVHPEERATWLDFALLGPIWSQFKYVGRVLAGFPAGLVDLINPQAWNMPLALALVWVSLAGRRHVDARFRPLLWIGPLTFVQAYLASGGANFGITPTCRYMGTAFPALALLGLWMARDWPGWLRHGVLALFVVMQGLWGYSFALDEWPG
jgi:hypothetical protein